MEVNVKEESLKDLSSKDSLREDSLRESIKDSSLKDSSKDSSKDSLKKNSLKDSSSKDSLKDQSLKDPSLNDPSKDSSLNDLASKEMTENMPFNDASKDLSMEDSSKDPLKDSSFIEASSNDASKNIPKNSPNQSSSIHASLPRRNSLDVSPSNDSSLQPDSNDETPDSESAQNPSKFLLQSALQLMHSCLEIDPFSDKSQNDPFDANCCSHGKIDPICGIGWQELSVDCRTHFKAISGPFLEAIKTTTNRPFHAIPIKEAICEECEKAYISFLQMIGETQIPLNELYSAIHECKENPPFLDDSAVMISNHFLNSLKLTLRTRKRILAHPDHCTPSLLHAAQNTINPNDFILCVVISIFIN